MFLWCRNISVGSGTLVTLLAEFMRGFMSPWGSGMDVPYIWLALTEYSGFSGQL